MMHFRDHHEHGQEYLCVTKDRHVDLSTMKKHFPVWQSMLHPVTTLPSTELRTSFPLEMTFPVDIGVKKGTFYALKSVLKEYELNDNQFPMLGRRILYDSVKWGSSTQKISGDSVYIPHYWEWTEDIIARCDTNLRTSKIYDAVYASLYSYDRNFHITRAFCESWCPQTNTLHTISGEWSISLWDLHRLGGLLWSAMESRERNGSRSLSRACQHLFSAYRLLEHRDEYRNGVPAKQWIQFWFKRTDLRYTKPPLRSSKERLTRPKKTYNPDGKIDEKPIIWSSEELKVFSLLGITDNEERRITYLAAYLVCWLCAFVLPEHDERLIRPSTFEVATQMACGAVFSLAPPVLARIYHSLNEVVTSDKPSLSRSCFPAQYLYGWFAVYFNTHHELEARPPGPLMVRFSGYMGAKHFNCTTARERIHDGSFIKPCRLMLTRDEEKLVLDNTKLDTNTLSYIISLRSSFLPVRRGKCFFLEPYCPHRFSRQFGFCQLIPRMLRRDGDRQEVTLAKALHYLRLLLFEGSHSTMTLPSYTTVGWKYLHTSDFNTWWNKMRVSDLREKVDSLIVAVESKKKPEACAGEPNIEDTGENLDVSPLVEEPIVRIGKRAILDDSSDEASETNFKHKRERKKAKQGNNFLEVPGASAVRERETPITKDTSNLLEGVASASDIPERETWDLADLDLEKEVPNLIIDSTSEVAPQRLTHGMGKPAPQPFQDVDLPNSSEDKSVESSPSVENTSISNSNKGSVGSGTKTVTEIHTTPCSSVGLPGNPVDIIDDDTAETITLLKDHFLRNLKNVPYDEVSQVRIRAKAVNACTNIRKLGGDSTSLQATFDSYVKDVETLLHMRKSISFDSDQLAHDISLIEEKVQLVQATFDAAQEESERQREHMVLLAEKRVDLEASLRSLRQQEATAKERHGKQLEVVSSTKLEVDALQQKLKDLTTSQAEILKLKQLESDLDKRKEAFDVSMH